MTKFITDQMMEEALDFLAMSSENLAQARANRVRAEHARKRVRANLILNSMEKSVVLREADAETDQRDAEAVDAECEMIRLDEYYRAARNRCDAIIEAWRSEQANARAGSKFQ